MVKAEDLAPVAEGSDWDAIFKGPAHPVPNTSAWCGPSNADAWCGKMPANESVMSRRCYLASVKFVDEQIVKILDVLDKKDLLENTFILWTADHGDGQGDHYHWRKGFPYEFRWVVKTAWFSRCAKVVLFNNCTCLAVFSEPESLAPPPPIPYIPVRVQSAHVPMLFRWPESVVASRKVNIARGTTIDNLVTELRDVFHTMVDAGEAISHVPQGHFKAEDGKSMMCLLSDPTGRRCDYSVNPGPWRKWLDMEHSTVYNFTNHWNAITDGSMKYIFNAWDASEQVNYPQRARLVHPTRPLSLGYPGCTHRLLLACVAL